jgi:lipopolysaccharide biosynthesis protein
LPDPPSSPIATAADARALPARLIAFYLPQYHPIPENDSWWGKGFTDWTNVARARPVFGGHYQPHLPAELGFYDLRVPEVRAAQAELARSHGIHGFCYYHYWFGGRRLLERPFQEVLSSGAPDFPFCLCWANENWTRVWDGGESEILVRQEYSAPSDLEHVRWLARAFSDRRYIRVAGRPLFLVYRVSSLPEPRRTADLWRDEAVRLGIGELFLCAVESFESEHGACTAWGFDAAVEFAPDWTQLGPVEGRGRLHRLARRFGQAAGYFENQIHSYPQLVSNMLAKTTPAYLRFPGVTPGWDNTARRKTAAVILHDSTPWEYEHWLATTLRRLQNRPLEQRICFVNAWNEWAEGNHLEPCQRWGRAYLEATRRALASVQPHERLA